MAFFDVFFSVFEIVFSNIYIFVLFRIIFLIIGLAELYKAMKSPQGQKVLLEYKPTYLQEATMNLMTFGLVIFCFIIVLWLDLNSQTKFDSFANFDWLFIPADIALGLFILIAYMIPKKVILTEEGIFHVGHLTPWKDVIDYDINEKRDRLKIKHYGRIFSFTYPTETVLPLPVDKDELKNILAKQIDGNEEKTPKKGRKRRQAVSKGKDGDDETDPEEPKKSSCKKKPSGNKKKPGKRVKEDPEENE